jgi:hypothetical protein
MVVANPGAGERPRIAEEPYAYADEEINNS